MTPLSEERPMKPSGGLGALARALPATPFSDPGLHSARPETADGVDPGSGRLLAGFPDS